MSKPKFHCKSEAQKKAIRANYARKAENQRKEFPEEFPFWARIKIDKHRTTLVIDEEKQVNEKSGKETELFVHREATHTKGHGEPVIPNPDKDDTGTMYLRSPRKLPKRMFELHNKNLSMPEELKQRYSKNNKKE